MPSVFLAPGSTALLSFVLALAEADTPPRGVNVELKVFDIKQTFNIRLLAHCTNAWRVVFLVRVCDLNLDRTASDDKLRLMLPVFDRRLVLGPCRALGQKEVYVIYSIGGGRKNEPRRRAFLKSYCFCAWDLQRKGRHFQQALYHHPAQSPSFSQARRCQLSHYQMQRHLQSGLHLII